jgi:uncharacterized membrane protein YgdD (TMEM256/DUF423 family)
MALAGGGFGFLGVALGAFGAHGLKARVSPEMLEVFRTGAHYQLLHALALLALVALGTKVEPLWAKVAGTLLTVGVVIFSGSLYALALSGVRQLGAVTPLGGVCLLAGWLTLTLGLARSRG